MFGWTKGLKKFVDPDAKGETTQSSMTDEERKFAAAIMIDASNAESKRSGTTNDRGIITETGIEDTWSDEHKLYKGGGLQWSTTLAYRSKKSRKKRPNSENNFIHNTLQIMHSNITNNTPEVTIEGANSNIDESIPEELTDVSRFNDKRNKFDDLFSKWTMDLIGIGPTIAKVMWDNDWMGGTGPDKWIGDVRLTRIKRDDFFPDPAILDLEKSINDCSYIIYRPRKKLDWIHKTFKEKAESITEEMVESNLIDEGPDPQQAYLYEYWHRGFPYYMPSERVKELREKAVQLEGEGDEFKAKDYYDSADGNLEGIHVAYVCNGELLSYVPYVKEDGKYPFVFRTKYFDDYSQWGYGDIRNIKIPQIAHNKADEIELDAMAKQGLGGTYYEAGAISSKQLDRINKNSGKGGMHFEVDRLEGMKDREGVQVPASITNFKEHKQRMIETVSQITPTMQGQSPGSGTPFATVEALGARSDVRLKQSAIKLESFIEEINELRLNLFAQFYTEDRYYRVKDSNGEVKDGMFNREKMMAEWVREERIDEQGNLIEIKEKYVPEFDCKVTIMSEKPNDRNYYTTVAQQMFQQQLMTGEDLWYTIEEGKFPPKEDILLHLQQQNMLMGMLAKIQELPPETQPIAQQMFEEALQLLTNTVGAAEGQQTQQQVPQ